jgi:hypothetical protein
MQSLVSIATNTWKVLQGILTLSFPENLYLVKDLVLDATTSFMQGVRKERARKNDCKACLFYTSWPAVAMYAVTLSAIVTRRSWIMYGILLVLTQQIGWVALRWILYILDDDELYDNIEFLQVWIHRFVREFGRIVNGRDAIHIIVSSSLIRSCPVGVDFGRFILRYKMHEVNLVAASLYDKENMAWQDKSDDIASIRSLQETTTTTSEY